MMRAFRLQAAGLLMACACTAFAQQALKPGLWEVHTRMPSDPEFDKSMAEMREALASMSPEERSQMEAAMGRSGAQIAASSKGGAAIRFCMTREQAERNEVSGAQGECTVGKQTRSGNTFSSSFTCTNPKSSGVTVVKVASPEAYTSKMTMVTEQGRTKDKTVIESDARWLSGDCGSIQSLTKKTK